MIEAGVKLGLSEKNAELLAKETAVGVLSNGFRNE